ncbi:MAG: hypothetical protein HXX19_03980 [Rhodoferax sp.]|nr:hypothetical protein [Rhodoferax sp.]
MAYASQRHEAFVIAQTSACQVLAQLQSENTSAVARRQVGVLLTMEALCLDALLITTFGSEYGRSEVGSLSSKADDFYRAWKNRCIVYAKGLPKATRAQFESMISSETEIGRYGYSPFQQAA